jgi:ribulose-5-phosphate 4-epimerase/fuculose-1-phosphate aldolase
MSAILRAKAELAIANRILARHGVFDEDGHISVRHPGVAGAFLLSRERTPALVEPADIMELAADASTAADEAGPLTVERFIHAAVLEARPDVKSVLFGTSPDLLSFGVTRIPLRPVIGSIGDMGMRIPVWEIANSFGSETDLLVSDFARARDLARCLGSCRVCLIRGRGFVATGRSLNDVVRMSVYLARNGRALAQSLALGAVRCLSEGEVAARLALDPESNAMRRGWEYWAREAGCEQWLTG